MTNSKTRDIKSGSERAAARVKCGEPNFKPKTIWTGDNLPIMRGMNSACVDLIYLDPPFNSKRNYAAPIGSKAAGAEFKDTWTLSDIDEEWIDLIAEKKENQKLYRVLLSAMTDSDKSYLVYMAVRLLEMKRILRPTGSIYLHCDPTMSHYLKLVMDAIFGRDNFRNEIVWCYKGGGVPKNAFAKKHDIILFYSNDEKSNTFNVQYAPYSEASRKLVESKEGVSIDGKERDLTRGAHMTDWWVEINSLQTWSPERTGFKTQKPEALLERIIRASSNKESIVFDPFCGCATTLATADALGRNWIGIDISLMATKLVKERIKDRQGLFRDIVSRDDIPQRTDMGKLPPYKTHKKTLFGEQEGKCMGCHNPFNIENLDVDHIIAKSKGGTDHIDNLQLLCGYCNSTKGDRGMEYLIRRLKLDDKALGIQRAI